MQLSSGDGEDSWFCLKLKKTFILSQKKKYYDYWKLKSRAWFEIKSLSLNLSLSLSLSLYIYIYIYI